VNPTHLIETFGTLGVLAIIFAETGLLVGFFLPGDSLLVTAGVLASQGKLNIAVILIGTALAAFIGAQVGYEIGVRAGPPLFNRPDSRLFKREYVEKAQHYFDRYGGKTIFLARFVPIVRTFANVMAGVGQMNRRRFVLYNLAGAVVWTIGITLLGYALGQIPGIDKYLLLVVAVIVAISVAPVAIEYLRHRKAAAVAAEAKVEVEVERSEI
jgi:membrane-associated protein